MSATHEWDYFYGSGWATAIYVDHEYKQPHFYLGTAFEVNRAIEAEVERVIHGIVGAHGVIVQPFSVTTTPVQWPDGTVHLQVNVVAIRVRKKKNRARVVSRMAG
jgi:hypothetical protein